MVDIVFLDTPEPRQRRSYDTDDALFMELQEGSNSQEDDEFECDDQYVEKVEEFYAKFVGGSQRHYSSRSSLRASFVSVASSVTFSDFDEDVLCASQSCYRGDSMRSILQQPATREKADRHPSISSSIDGSEDSAPTLPTRRTSHSHHDMHTCDKEGCDRTPTKPGRRTSFRWDCGPRQPGRRTSYRADAHTREETKVTDNSTASPVDFPVGNTSDSSHLASASADDKTVVKPARRTSVEMPPEIAGGWSLGSCDVSCSSKISKTIRLDVSCLHQYPEEAPSVSSRGA